MMIREVLRILSKFIDHLGFLFSKMQGFVLGPFFF